MRTLVMWAALATAGVAAADGPRWLPAAAEKLPRWRGFNLLEKFNVGRQGPFVEDDFRLIARLGFNFVRLPMDYRAWIVDGDWRRFDEEVLAQIDEAVGFGQRYGIHVCLNFHRAPGYTVAKPPERLSLWTDAEAQEVCALHWARFARRYKGVPPERLSFNLMNEPSNVEPAVYAGVVEKLAAAIRAEDPRRLIISDGLRWGQLPIAELQPLRIAQATRGYTPGELSHYKASWVNSKDYPRPEWPRLLPPVGTLLAPQKKEGSHPIVISGPLPALRLRMRVATVSMAATLVVAADGRVVFEKAFKCGPGEGEWKKAEYKPQYRIWQNTYDRDYTAELPAATRQATIRVTAGDWLHLAELGLQAEGAAESVVPLKHGFGEPPTPFGYDPARAEAPIVGLPRQDRQWLWENCILPWKQAEAQGIGVMVGEWGAYNKTPHEVVLRWAEDSLANWQRAGWGWALWNFRGPFGVLDSGRDDVAYEDFEGHKLDRKLLDLLRRY